MIIYLYFFSLYLLGLSILLLFPQYQKGQRSLFLDASLSLMLGLFLPSLFLYFSNLFDLPLTSKNTIIFYLSSLIIFPFFSRKDLFIYIPRIIKESKKFILSSPFFSTILIFAFLGIIARGSVEPIWMGDGMAHWAPKSLEWLKLQKISYGAEAKESFKIWLGYPLYHNINILFHLHLLPLLPAYSVKISDLIHVLGLFFSMVAFFDLMGLKRKEALFYACTSLFVQKNLLSYIIPGYADLGIAYYYFLAVLCFFSFQENRENTCHLIFSGICLGIVAIIKDEGLIRIGILSILIILFSCFFSKKTFLPELKKGRNIIKLISPFLFIIIIDKINHPAFGHEQEYLARIDLSPSHLFFRAKLILQVFIYGLKPESIIKSMWPVLFLIGLYSSYSLFTKEQGRASKDTKRRKEIIIFYLLLFIFNFIFNYIPSWIAEPSTNIHDIAIQVIDRLHIQITSFLSVVCSLKLRDIFISNYEKTKFRSS